MASDSNVVTKIYEQIPLEAMQQVSDSYMAWYVDRVTRQLDDTMAQLRSELRENDQKEASYRPSPQELEAIERLQRSGVTGVDLLDRLVEQGDDWLAVTMRRLDHFERTGLAPKDYSTWCEHALSGAYDWIDHDRLASGAPLTGGPSPSPSAAPPQRSSGASRSSASASSSSAPSSTSVPDWMSRNASRSSSSSSSSASAPSEDGPTAPVPSMQRQTDTGSGGAYGAPGASSPSSVDDPDGDPNARRNIFRIFTN
jgi:hypothetical protein